MYVAYIDDAGDVQTLPAGGGNIQPVLAFAGVALATPTLAQFTRDFLALKRQAFPGLMGSRHLLDDVLVEIKGAELRTMARGSHRDRRRAIRFLDDLLRLLADYEARIFGRVWIKGFDVAIDGRAVNTFSIQSMCQTFQNFLVARDDVGMMIIDSSTPGLNAAVSFDFHAAIQCVRG